MLGAIRMLRLRAPQSHAFTLHIGGQKFDPGLGQRLFDGRNDADAGI